MDNYEDDFDEEIEESFEESKAFKSNARVEKKQQPTSMSSNRELKPTNNYGSSKDLENKSRTGVRKTVPLSKIQPKKTNDEDDEEEAAKKLIFKNIPKKKNQQRKKSYDDQIEEDLDHDQSPKMRKKKHDLKSLEEEVLRISKSHERRSVHSTPPKTQNSQNYNAGYFDRLRNLFDSDVYNRSAKEIEAENNRIRDSLKDLNDQLTKIVERSRLSNLAPRKMEFKNKNAEDKIRTTMREIENNQKILELTATEYTTLKSRLDQIKSPTFIMDLEEKINDTKNKTETTKKLNKELHLENGNLGKNLDGIDQADGVAPMIQEANKKARELAVMKKKLDKLQEMNLAFEEENTVKSAKYEKLQEQYRKANSEASQYHVAAEDDRLAVRYNGLVAQVKLLEDHMKFALNKNEKYLKSQVERAIEELYVENMKENEKLERLDEMIEEQKQVLREMIEKEEHRTDKATRDVIGKIKASLDPQAYMEPSGNSEPQISHIRSVNSLQSKPPLTNWKNQQDKYNDLPVYDVSRTNVKIDSLLNKKEKLKKELNLLKERARNGEERTTSQTPKAETDRKEAFTQNKSNSKPNLRQKNKNVSEENHSLQQAEQEKIKETPKVEQRRNSRDNVNVKPDFAKPSFKKSNQTSTSQKEIIQLPDTHSSNSHNQVSDFDSHNTFGLNKSPPKKEEQYSIPNSIKKNEELKLPENEKFTLSKNDTPLALGLKDQSKTFITHQGGYNSNKKEELSLPGMFNEPKKEVKKNEEIVFDSYNPSVQKQSLSNNNNNSNNLQQLNSNTIKKEDDQDDLVIGGGRSRLNKLKKGTTTTTSYEPTGLELPGQKNPSTTNINAMPLTLESDKRDRNPKLLSNNKEEDLFILPKENTNIVKKSSDLNGLNFVAELTLENKDTEKKGGRDRSHLNNEKKTDDDLLFFGSEKKTTTVNQSKGLFDPDELFGNNNKKPAFENNKNDAFQGKSVEKIGFDDNSTSNFLANKNSLNQQSERRDINGKLRNVGAMDEELFGGSINFKNNNNYGNKKDSSTAFGELDFGGFGKPEQSKQFNNLSKNTNDEEPKVEIKRMRMNDLKKTENKEKEINLAQKAEQGGGFFDELEL